MHDTKQSTDDLAILEQLNNDYVHSDQFNDVKRFSEFLAEDFIVQTPGVTRNREEFLDYIAKPRPFKNLAVHDVNIRILSDVALIHARATYTMLADGVDQEARDPKTRSACLCRAPAGLQGRRPAKRLDHS